MLTARRTGGMSSLDVPRVTCVVSLLLFATAIVHVLVSREVISVTIEARATEPAKSGSVFVLDDPGSLYLLQNALLGTKNVSVTVLGGSISYGHRCKPEGSPWPDLWEQAILNFTKRDNFRVYNKCVPAYTSKATVMALDRLLKGEAGKSDIFILAFAANDRYGHKDFDEPERVDADDNPVYWSALLASKLLHLDTRPVVVFFEMYGYRAPKECIIRDGLVINCSFSCQDDIATKSSPGYCGSRKIFGTPCPTVFGNLHWPVMSYFNLPYISLGDLICKREKGFEHFATYNNIFDLWPDGHVHPPCSVHEEIAKLFMQLTLSASLSMRTDNDFVSSFVSSGRQALPQRILEQGEARILACEPVSYFSAEDTLRRNASGPRVCDSWILLEENDKPGWVFSRNTSPGKNASLAFNVSTTSGNIVVTYLRSYARVGSVSIFVDGLFLRDVDARWESHDSLPDALALTSLLPGYHEVNFVPNNHSTEYFKVLGVKGC